MLSNSLNSRIVFLTSIFFILSAWISPDISAETFSDNSSGLARHSAEAVLYYHPSCGHCTKVKQYLKKINRTITMKNIANPKYQMELNALGQRGVPVLVVGNQVIVGSTPIISYLSRHQEVLR